VLWTTTTLRIDFTEALPLPHAGTIVQSKSTPSDKSPSDPDSPGTPGWLANLFSKHSQDVSNTFFEATPYRYKRGPDDKIKNTGPVVNMNSKPLAPIINSVAITIIRQVSQDRDGLLAIRNFATRDREVCINKCHAKIKYQFYIISHFSNVWKVKKDRYTEYL
jgi:hypothetical protein